MTQEWLDTIHDACRDISSEAYNLQSLARAFHLTGNASHAKELQQVVEVLLTSSREIPKAVGQHLHDQVKKDQESINALLKVALIPKE